MKYFNRHIIYNNSLKQIKNKVSPTVYNRCANYITTPRIRNFIYSKILTIFIDPSEKEYYGSKIKILELHKAFKQYKDNL
jgi:hypothetical protein